MFKWLFLYRLHAKGIPAHSRAQANKRITKFIQSKSLTTDRLHIPLQLAVPASRSRSRSQMSRQSRGRVPERKLNRDYSLTLLDDSMIYSGLLQPGFYCYGANIKLLLFTWVTSKSWNVSLIEICCMLNVKLHVKSFLYVLFLLKCCVLKQVSYCVWGVVSLSADIIFRQREY